MENFCATCGEKIDERLAVNVHVGLMEAKHITCPTPSHWEGWNAEEGVLHG